MVICQTFYLTKLGKDKDQTVSKITGLAQQHSHADRDVKMKALFFSTYTSHAEKIAKKKRITKKTDKENEIEEEKKLEDPRQDIMELEGNVIPSRNSQNNNISRTQSLPQRQGQGPRDSEFVESQQLPSPSYSAMSLESQSIGNPVYQSTKQEESFYKLLAFMENMSDELHQIKMQQASTANTLNVLTYDVNALQITVAHQPQRSRGKGKGKKGKRRGGRS